MIKELTSFPKRARTIDWEDGKLIFDGDKVMLMPELSVEVIQQIGAYPALVGFHVKHYPLTDEQIQPLAGAKKMVNVGIEYAELTDACFAVFATMPTLEYLLLAGNPAITGKGLSMMQASKVALLDLSATSLDDEGLHRAAQLPKLNHLHVRQTQITYEGVLGIAFNKRLSLRPGDLFTKEQMELFASLQRNQAKKKLEVDADAVHQAEQVLYAFFAAMTQWEKYTDQTGLMRRMCDRSCSRSGSSMYPRSHGWGIGRSLCRFLQRGRMPPSAWLMPNRFPATNFTFMRRMKESISTIVSV